MSSEHAPIFISLTYSLPSKQCRIAADQLPNLWNTGTRCEPMARSELEVELGVNGLASCQVTDLFRLHLNWWIGAWSLQWALSCQKKNSDVHPRPWAEGSHRRTTAQTDRRHARPARPPPREEKGECFRGARSLRHTRRRRQVLEASWMGARPLRFGTIRSNTWRASGAGGFGESTSGRRRRAPSPQTTPAQNKRNPSREDLRAAAAGRRAEAGNHLWSAVAAAAAPRRAEERGGDDAAVTGLQCWAGPRHCVPGH